MAGLPKRNLSRSGNPFAIQVDSLNQVYIAQLMTYMKLMNLKKGLLINFNGRFLREGAGSPLVLSLCALCASVVNPCAAVVNPRPAQVPIGRHLISLTQFQRRRLGIGRAQDLHANRQTRRVKATGNAQAA